MNFFTARFNLLIIVLATYLISPFGARLRYKHWVTLSFVKRKVWNHRSKPKFYPNS